jgi:hypothetical protein
MSKINPDLLIKIVELFEKKNWPINNSNANTISLFDRFCERLKLLDDNQKLLVIELSYNYTWIQLKTYLEHFYDSLLLLGDNVFNSYDKIFVYPLLSISNSVPLKTKSAGFLHYMFETDDYTWLSNKFHPNTSIRYLYENFDNNDSILLIVDDYVGSGGTAVEICNEYLSTKIKSGHIKNTNIKVVTIAAQIEGIETVKNKVDIEVVSALKFNKGISDKYFNNEKKEKEDVMNEIEKILKISPELNYGYKKSEALITMLNKTPNNTFPVYWFENRKKVAPFPRKKIFKP